MPASNGGRSGGKNKKKDGDLMENVSFSCHFPLGKNPHLLCGSAHRISVEFYVNSRRKQKKSF